jgi:hypothetical protein
MFLLRMTSVGIGPLLFVVVEEGFGVVGFY